MINGILSKEDNIIVSSLALGCDKAAHEGCLDAGGKTIAIVASGLNIVHPKENEPLQQRILESGGLILSEQPFGMKANPTRLVARNRLQAAWSDAVVLRNARSRAAVCTPCTLHVNIASNVLRCHILNILTSMRAINY